MDLNRIEKLLEKYFEAQTTEAEEQVLRDYFTGDDVAEHLEQYSTMFTFFSNAKQERFTKQVPLKTSKAYYRWISVAAVAVLVFGIYFGNRYQEQREAEYAYLQTKKALGLLAQNLDRGTEKVAYLHEFEETKQKIYKNN
jgi:anti-sigma-K factor RskA